MWGQDSTLRCSECGADVYLDTAPDGPPAVLWFLDARGHVLERGTVGEGHLQLTGDARLGETPRTVYCPGPVLPAPAPAPAVVDLREPAAVDVTEAAGVGQPVGVRVIA